MLAVRYAIFCLFAMGANLGLQFVAHRGFGLEFWPALGIGTAGGLVLKYVLDRNYIFAGRGVSLLKDARRLSLSGLLGLGTTAVFWSAEWLGHKFLPVCAGRYIGGAIGLMAGYALKYWMDRRWVFGACDPATSP